MSVTGPPLKSTRQIVTAGSSFSTNTSPSRHLHLISFAIANLSDNVPGGRFRRGKKKTGSCTDNLEMSHVHLLGSIVISVSSVLSALLALLISSISANVSSTHLRLMDVKETVIIMSKGSETSHFCNLIHLQLCH